MYGSRHKLSFVSPKQLQLDDRWHRMNEHRNRGAFPDIYHLHVHTVKRFNSLPIPRPRVPFTKLLTLPGSMMRYEQHSILIFFKHQRHRLP